MPREHGTSPRDLPLQAELTDKYERPAALARFTELLEANAIRFEDPQAEHQGGYVEYRPVQLLVGSEELARALDHHPTCPDVVKRWLRDKPLQTRAAQDEELE